MPMLQKGGIYMEPTTPQPGLREHVSDITNFMMQLKMQEYLKKKQKEEEALKQQQELQTAITLAQEKAKIMTPKEQAEAGYYQGLTRLLPDAETPETETPVDGTIVGQAPIRGQFTGGKSQFQVKSLGPTGPTFERMPSEAKKEQALQEKIKETQTTELAKGITPDKAGLYSLAQESIKNIQDIKKILFPTGEAKSFKRTIAFASNLPGGTAPIVGAILPQRGWGKAEQDVFRKMGAALSGRQLIQTGVAARPEETQKLISQFAPSLGSNPESALAGLNELEDFYKNFLNTLKTRGIESIAQTNVDGFQITPSGNKYKIIQ